MGSTPTERRVTLTDLVAEEIRALMARRRISGAQLARELGVSQMWVSYRLRGSQPIDVNDLDRIAVALGSDPVELLRSAAQADTGRFLPPVIPAHPVDVRSPRTGTFRSRLRAAVTPMAAPAVAA